MVNKSKTNRCIVGIDEAGRGPVAGPLSVCALCIKGKLNLKQKPFAYLLATSGFKDSKKLSPKKREEIFNAILKDERIVFAHSFVHAKSIDKWGIKKALDIAVARTLKKMACEVCELLLDGALKAPARYRQKTIVKGDEKVLEIALASVVAKVKRDKYMEKIHKKYPSYAFNKHKGYGTKKHLELIQKYGKCSEHRKSFLKGVN